MDGILVVDKPKGMTSHDVVAFVRKRFGLKKVGHAGTLDPIATGVLVILIGRCTKSSNRLMADDKEYEASLTLGAASDTGDAYGKLTPSGRASDYTAGEIEAAFKEFIGEIEQTPPIYSAIKFKGRKLYEFARKGIDVERKARKVRIKEIDIIKISLPEVRFMVSCSKGTYIRQLCADIGSRLGCGGYMSELRRIRSGRFSINEALDMDALKKLEHSELEKKLKADTSPCA